MITAQIINQIYEILISDETFCRLLAYGKDPLSEDKDDIVGSVNHVGLMDDIFEFSPQSSKLEELQRTRVCLYKGYTKMQYIDSAVVQETIQLDIYIPHALVDKEGRVYQVENKIVALLQRKPVGIGYLDYIDGQFVPLPPISGYAEYKMVFTVKEGKPNIGKL